MAKKQIKKSAVAKKLFASSAAPVSPPAPADVEMPMAHADDVDDVAEDYQVMDMSDIAPPVIEFQMPNLEERIVEKEDEKPVESTSVKKAAGKPGRPAKAVAKPENSSKKLEKPARKVQKAADNSAEVSEDSDSDSEIIQLTAEKLNNELVRLRPTVVKSKRQLTSKLMRQKKELEKKIEKKDIGKEENERKIKRLEEEISSLKTVDNDTIAKFGVVNTKTLSQLKIEGNTPVAERLMYKLACQPLFLNKMKEVKAKYIEWNKTAAFFMQRLGQQYSNKPDKKKTNEPKKGKKVEVAAEESDDVEDSGEEEPVESDNEHSAELGEEYDESDVEMVDSDEEKDGDEAAKKRRNTLLELINVKEDKSRPALKPKKRKVQEEDDDDYEESTKNDGKKKKRTKEDVKRQMKEVLDKELKTKEVKKPKQGKKATVAKNGKAKKAVAAPAPEPEEESEDSEDDETGIWPESGTEDEAPDQKTLVLKVDLSKGGKIAQAPKTASVSKPTKAAPEVESDDDDDESSAFFLPKGASAAAASSSAKRSANVKATEVVDKDEGKKKTIISANKNPSTSKPTPGVAAEKKKGSSKNVATGEVHPSWAASQLKKKELAAAKPCGKKITFSDDDD